MSVIIQLKGGTAAKWQEVNPTLAEREMGIETDTHNYKIGDGFTSWNSLEYSSFPQNAEDGGNKVTTFDNPTDIQYPSAKLVYDQLEAKEGASVAALNNKVDKIIGKSLSDQNFTAQEKFKLSTILAGANPNVIETIKLNGVALSVTNKGVSFLAIQPSEKGADNGVATLDANGLVPLSQLPSYVSEIVELTTMASSAPSTYVTGEKYYNTTSKLVFTAVSPSSWGTGVAPTTAFMYHAIDSALSYRWSGTTMVQIGEPIAIDQTRGQGVLTVPSSKLLDDELNKSTVYNVTTNNPALIGVGEYYSTAMNNLGSIKSAKASVPVTLRKDGLTIMYLTAEYEKTTLVITGAATADGSLYISLNGATPVPTALISGLSAIDTAAAIYINAAAFTGWTLTDPNGTATIIFTKDDVGYCKTPVITLGSTEIDILTIKNAPTSTGNITISDGDLGSSVAIAISHTVDTTPELVAIKIAAGTYTGWSAVANGGSVIFTKTSIGAATPIACTNALGCEFVITRASTGTESTGTTYTTTRTKYGKDKTWVIEQCINSAAWSTPASWRRLLTSTNLVEFDIPGEFETSVSARAQMPSEIRKRGSILSYSTWTPEIQTIKVTNACVTDGIIDVEVDGTEYHINVTAGISIVSITTALAYELGQSLSGRYTVVITDPDTILLTSLNAGMHDLFIFSSNFTGVLATPLQVQRGTFRNFIKERYVYSDTTTGTWVLDAYWVLENTLKPSINPYVGGVRNIKIINSNLHTATSDGITPVVSSVLTIKKEGFVVTIDKRAYYIKGNADISFSATSDTRWYLYLNLGLLDPLGTYANYYWDTTPEIFSMSSTPKYGNYYLIATCYKFVNAHEWSFNDSSLAYSMLPYGTRMTQQFGKLFYVGANSDYSLPYIEIDTVTKLITIPAGYGVFSMESNYRFNTPSDGVAVTIPLIPQYGGTNSASTLGVILFNLKTLVFTNIASYAVQPDNTLIVGIIRRDSISTSVVGNISVWGFEHYRINGLNVNDVNNVVSRNDDVKPLVQAAIFRKYNDSYPHGLDIPADWTVSITNTRRFSFLQISDLHGDTKRLSNFVEYGNYLGDDLDFGLNCGDTISGYYNDSFGFMQAEMLRLKKPFMTTIGNHDCGGNTSITQSGTSAQVYTKFIEPFITEMGSIHPSTVNYYYRDFTVDVNKALAPLETKTIRLITLYEFDNDDIDTTPNPDVFKIPRGNRIFGSTQIAWFIAKLKEASDNGYAVLVSLHQSPSGLPNLVVDSNFSSALIKNDVVTLMSGNIIQDIIEAFRTGTNLTSKSYTFSGAASYLSALNITTNFVEKGEFICYLCGHHHADFVGVSSLYPEQNIVAVTTGAASGNGNRFDDLSRIEGSKSEDAFNLITVDLETKAVFVVRIGANMNNFLVERKKTVFEYILK